MTTQNRASEVAAVCYTFAIISCTATALRIYCRGWVMKAFALDDWLAVSSQVVFIAFCANGIIGTYHGIGKHLWDISPNDVPIAMQKWWTCEILYVLSGMLIKISIAILLHRICELKIHKIIIWVVLSVTQVYSLVFFLLFMLQCQPVDLFWLRFTADAPSGSCLDTDIIANSFYAYSAINCCSDWTYSILPMFIVWRLQMRRRMKISVILVLATGVIASSATIVRLPYLHNLTNQSDFIYRNTENAIWSVVEVGIGITAAATATLRPLLRRVLGDSSSTSSYSTSVRQLHGPENNDRISAFTHTKEIGEDYEFQRFGSKSTSERIENIDL